MKFKPFLDKYNFNEETLTMSFPKYLHKPIEVWLFKVLSFSNMTTTIYPRTKCLGQGLVDELQIVFREVFPSKWNEAIYFIFDDKDRFANFLAFCLQNFSNRSHADRLEEILSKGGSGLEVIKIKKESSDFDKGVYDLVERVSLLVKEKSNKALLSDSLLEEAWSFCYSRNPDYEKVVSKSCDFLEGYIGEIYFPKDPKPQLAKFCKSFNSNPEKLSYKGDTIVHPKSILTDLLQEATNIRGQHTKGKGRKPTKDEAEFVLHTVIHVWNLHNK